jgi:2-polyprenyl-3-methyl-5-hydroxy-6-metoxy-1,4-benzoquinol methylase
MNFKNRSTQTELLDQDDIPFADLVVNLHELNFINRWLGGHQITIAGLKKLIKSTFGRGQNPAKGSKLIVCEIGCGGGDNLRVVQRWLNKHHIKHQIIGIDLKQECIDYCQKQTDIVGTWICSDYEKVLFETKPDIVFSSLFCHHFTESELITQIRWLKQNTTIGFFINDLQRHWLAYYLIKILTRLFSNSYLVQNDAPLSVARGYSRNEWRMILNKSDNNNTKINWKWAFRWLIVSEKKN